MICPLTTFWMYQPLITHAFSSSSRAHHLIEGLPRFRLAFLGELLADVTFILFTLGQASKDEVLKMGQGGQGHHFTPFFSVLARGDGRGVWALVDQ